MRLALCFVAMIGLMFLCSTVFAASPGDLTFGGLVNSRADTIEARAGIVLDKSWEAGLFSQYFSKDPSHDWSVGGYAKMLVNPDATLPVAGWFPSVGDWLNLPDTIPASTYLIGKGGVMPIENGVDMFLCVGVGASAGPVCVEYIYRVIESGDADQPSLSSGAELSFGLKFPI